VLAVATFSSVRSANRAARVAELSLREQLRPVLVNSNLDDPAQKIMFADRHWARAGGGEATAEHQDGTVYLTISMRNVGSGIAALQGWHPWTELQFAKQDPAPTEDFRTTTRDLLIPPGGMGLWQGALRDSSEEIHPQLAAAVTERRAFSVDLLYTDHVGAQRTISRFALIPGESRWMATVSRHWNLDSPGPR